MDEVDEVDGVPRIRKDILEFNHETGTWTLIAAMNEPRTGHAVTLIPLDDYDVHYKKWCRMPSTTNSGDSRSIPAKAAFPSARLGKIYKKHRPINPKTEGQGTSGN